MNTRNGILLVLCIAIGTVCFGQRQMEKLDRGFIAVRTGNKVFLSWRSLASDPPDLAFNIERDDILLNKEPIRNSTNFLDSTVEFTGNWHHYYLWPVLKGKKPVSFEDVFRLPPDAKEYLSVPLQIPPGGEVMGSAYTYSANDASVADLDNDGIYEIILKWHASNAKNPPQTGFTGNTIIDAYKLDGRLMWRVDLGINIRSGAAYTQFLVYDLNGDGYAEMICKTADGTRDGQGKIIGDSTKDWRTYGDPGQNIYGKVLNGPEYISVFEGSTGRVLATENYVPDRYPLNGWGGIGGNGGNDSTGSRPDHFTAGIAYLDGKMPSAVFVRGWYGRSVVAAWDWRGDTKKEKLTLRWVFDSKDKDNPYSGMGNHSLSVADVDNDGKDEVCIGSMTVDDDGKGLYTTGLRHGDAMHLGDLDPSNPGLEVFGIHENEGRTVALKTPGAAQFDARTGKILFSVGPGVDVGRGVAADIDPRYPGFENWGGPGGLRDAKGKTISDKVPSSTNFVIWWDDDLTRELLDDNHIDKWDWNTGETKRLLTAEGCVSNNGTKANPCLTADIFGDWREEVIWRTADSKELRIYTSTILSTRKFYTLMQDPQYRLSIAWQNSSYNQPPHTGFYFGAGMKPPPKPNIHLKSDIKWEQ